MLALTLAGCPRRPPPPTPAPVVASADTASHADDAGPAPPPAPATTDRWTRAYTNDPLRPEESRSLMAEVAVRDGDGAALTLGRRTPLDGLPAVLGTLPPQRLDVFLRGITGRPLGALAMPPSWRARWAQEPASVPLGTIFGRNAMSLEAPAAAVVQSMLLDGDVEHQVAGARALQNASVAVPPVASLLALHPVAFPIAVRSLAQRGGVTTTVWLNLLAALGARVQNNPRSWGGAWLALLESMPPDDPALRASLTALEPSLSTLELTPAPVQAAWRCALALHLDRFDAGRRTETCATGDEAWRVVATLAERARPPMPPAQLAQTLRDLLPRAGSEPRAIEPIAEAAALLPAVYARPLFATLAGQRDPGVLAALLGAMQAHPEHARAMAPAALSQLLQAPFDLPEPVSLEARLHAVALRRDLHLTGASPETTVRALRQAAEPDAGIGPADGVLAPAAGAGTWVLHTTAGTIRIALRADTAPEALRVLADATRAGTYAHTVFHRVVPGFVAQGGDPRHDGYGGTTRIVTTELSGARFERGAVGVALAGLDTGGMQFFITLADAPHLDARYPYLGQVVEGMNIADRLLPGDEIVDATVEAPGGP